ncbi:hypothetical protein BX666DRAFT_1240329 [Dichotomocladium elegans]|nr:hypothetical protein BX666DRAFT_1240329 [Dichotomocladium elegans]
MTGAISTDSVSEWSVAIQEANLLRVQQLLHSNPDLLWTSLDDWDPEGDASHIIEQLLHSGNLGSSLDNICALHYTLLQYYEPLPGDTLTLAQLQTQRLLSFLIENATKEDLDNKRWGNCNNTTLHLVSFLGHFQVARRLIEDKNVSPDIPNDLGHLARNVAQTEELAHILSKGKIMKQQQQQRQIRSVASNDRFKQLRQIAESTPSSKEVNSTRQAEGRFFRPGHVAESKRKVLTDEEVELEKQRARRREEVSILAKRSAVKNNPLFKKIQEEQQQQQQLRPGRLRTQIQDKSVEPTSTANENHDSNDEENNKKKRNSKVISSLRNKTYVSSSVFRQSEPERPIIAKRVQRQTQEDDQRDGKTDEESLQRQHQEEEAKRKQLEHEEQKMQEEERWRQQEQQQQQQQQQHEQRTHEYQHQEKHAQLPPLALDTTSRDIVQRDQLSPITPINEYKATRTSDIPSADARKSMERRRLSGSQKSQWAIGMTSWASVMHKTERLPTVPAEDSGSDDEQWYDSQDDLSPRKRADAEAKLTGRKPSEQNPLQVPSPVSLSDEDKEKSTPGNNPPDDPTLTSFLCSQPLSIDELLVDSYLSGSTASAASSPFATAKNHDEEVKKHKGEDQPEEVYGSVAVTTTSRYIRRLSREYNRTTDESDKFKDHSLSPLHHDDSQFKIKRTPLRTPSDVTSSVSKNSGATIKRSQTTILQSLTNSVPLGVSQKRSDGKPSRHGKLYLRVNAASNILLPLPKEQTYVRCVISDDKYEYMSRYEVLGQHVQFNYECIIDTEPDMIVTISLHVRPDLHLRSKMPIARLFSSSRKHQKGAPTLSSYIYQEDGSIGRARFALAHMMRGCFMRSYSAKFDCFNAWSTERSHRQKHQQDDNSLKVIGDLDVEMLYLPVDDPAATIPRNLRDCDMAIRIQQWNETFWNTENLTTSVPRITPGAHQYSKQPTRSATLL